MQNEAISKDKLVAEKFRQCEVCAYHESGHILFAYLCGYRCRHVQLINEPNEEGYSSIAIIDYGKDAETASKFMASQQGAQYFQSLPLAGKLESIEVGRRLSRIFLGGSVAAAVYNNHENVHIPLPMQIDFLDLQRVEFIQHVIRKLQPMMMKTLLSTASRMRFIRWPISTSGKP